MRKPLTTSLESAQKIVSAYQKAKITLAVNYTRRWNDQITKLKNQIAENKYGKLQKIIGIYNKGTLHNGSHMVDLLSYFFGEVSQAKCLHKINDWKKSDSTVDAFINFKNQATAHLIATSNNHYEIHEIDMLFEKARINLPEFGTMINICKTIKNPIYKQETILGPITSRETNLGQTLLHIPAKIIDSIEKNIKLPCTGLDVIKTQQVCLDLITQANSI